MLFCLTMNDTCAPKRVALLEPYATGDLAAVLKTAADLRGELTDTAERETGIRTPPTQNSLDDQWCAQLARRVRAGELDPETAILAALLHGRRCAAEETHDLWARSIDPDPARFFVK